MPWLPPLPVPVTAVPPLPLPPTAPPDYLQPHPPTPPAGRAWRLLLVPAYAALLGAAGSAAYFYTQAARLSPVQEQAASDAPSAESLASQTEEAVRRTTETRNSLRQAEEERSRLEKHLAELRTPPPPVQDSANLAAELKKAEEERDALQKELEKKLAETPQRRIITGREPKDEDESILVTLANGMLSAINQGEKKILDIIFENEVAKDGKTLSKSRVIKSVTDNWSRYPTRRCEPMGLGLGKGRVELLYFYSYTDADGKTTRGYAKQTWRVNMNLRIIDFREERSEKDIYNLSAQVEAVNFKEQN